MGCARLILLVGVTLCIAWSGTDHALAQGSYLEKIYTTPDYTQTDTAYGGFPDENGVSHGGVFCGPCAASNSLMWLDNNGWGNLAPNSSDRKKDQHDLIEIIASDEYMDSYDNDGTSPTRIANGMYDYIRDCGYQFNRFEWQGWRGVPSQFDTGIDIPDLDWMRAGIEGPGTVQLWSVGWYDYNAATDNYVRTGGHWVTMVGYGPNGSGQDCMIIHDPSPRTGYSLRNEYVLPTPLTSGTKDGSQDLTGQYWLTGWPINSVGDRAILDGVFVIDVTLSNHAPVAENDAYAMNEDQQIIISVSAGLLSNDGDIDGDPLNSIRISNPTRGDIALNSNGSFTYTPRADFHGTDQFTYRASDGMSYSNTATVYFTIASVNDVPVAADDFYSVDQDHVLNLYAYQGLMANDSDADNNDSDSTNDVKLNLVVQSDPANGLLQLYANGAFQYTPEAGYHGTDYFTYQLFDGEAWSDLATVTINVLASIMLPGDATGDGKVDRDDVAILAQYWGQTGADWAMGDFDGDGLVGPKDAAMLAANWGGSESEAAAVPEPLVCTQILLLLAFLGTGRARPARRR